MTLIFADHVALLGQLLDGRQEIVGRIQSHLLNVRGKETSRRRDRPYFERLLDSCFFSLPGLPSGSAQLTAQLAARHEIDGFEPVVLKQFVNQFDPLELIPRAYHYWDHHHWPGRSGREQYAHSIYAAVMLRRLEKLSMRLWDDGRDEAEGRLEQIQSLIGRLNGTRQPLAFVRDARWLIPIAQGPLTRALAPYFTVAAHVSGSLTDATRLGLHKAGARLAGGHLRSQLRYRSWESGRPLNDPQNLVITRNSNALDGALVLRDLVALLQAYGNARLTDHPDERLDLADAILQGVSADPELFVTRLDLLPPYTMIEPLFIEDSTDEAPRYSAWGDTHIQTLTRYRELLGALAPSLIEDAAAFDPARHVYSPHGIAYGFCADVLSNIAWDMLLSNPSFDLSLEDMFVGLGGLEQKLARAKGWEALPRRAGERAHFDYSPDAAAQSFGRLMDALGARARARTEPDASGRQARIFVLSDADSSSTARLPDECVDANEHVLTSDVQRVSMGAASFCPKDQFLEDRNEGRFLASLESDGEWVAVSKVILTLLTALGRDAVVSNVPSAMVSVLRLSCPELIVLPSEAAPQTPDRTGGDGRNVTQDSARS